MEAYDEGGYSGTRDSVPVGTLLVDAMGLILQDVCLESARIQWAECTLNGAMF